MVSYTDILSRIWPDWQIEGLLGHGAYGYVYQARHEDYGAVSSAAVKIIPVPQESSEIEGLEAEGMDGEEIRAYYDRVVQGFVNEIRMLISLKGAPHIVSIEDFKVVKDPDKIQWYILIRMELLTPFLVWLNKNSLPEDDVVRLGIELCSALDICHRQNIIHRDIKPQNIFVDRFGSFRLGDFGIARKMEGITGVMSQKGSYGYMAPEVSHSLPYDMRADVYSLGLVMYQQVNEGRPPFLLTPEQAKNPRIRNEALRKRLSGNPLPPPCEASPELSRIILKACAYDPSARYANAAEMGEALQNYRYCAANPPAPVSEEAPGGTDTIETDSIRPPESAGTPHASAPPAGIPGSTEDVKTISIFDVQDIPLPGDLPAEPENAAGTPGMPPPGDSARPPEWYQPPEIRNEPEPGPSKPKKTVLIAVTLAALLLLAGIGTAVGIALSRKGEESGEPVPAPESADEEPERLPFLSSVGAEWYGYYETEIGKYAEKPDARFGFIHMDGDESPELVCSSTTVNVMNQSESISEIIVYTLADGKPTMFLYCTGGQLEYIAYSGKYRYLYAYSRYGNDMYLYDNVEHALNDKNTSYLGIGPRDTAGRTDDDTVTVIGFTDFFEGPFVDHVIGMEKYRRLMETYFPAEEIDAADEIRGAAYTVLPEDLVPADGLRVAE